MIEPVYSYLVPTVVEDRPTGESVPTTSTRGPLRTNIIFLGTPIDDTIANLVWCADAAPRVRSPDKDINIYINSPGGDITALFAIYDTMQFVRDVNATIASGRPHRGWCLWPRDEGQTLALPHARVMLHQPWGGGVGGPDQELPPVEILGSGPDGGDSRPPYRPAAGPDRSRHRPGLRYLGRGGGGGWTRRRGDNRRNEGIEMVPSSSPCASRATGRPVVAKFGDASTDSSAGSAASSAAGEEAHSRSRGVHPRRVRQPSASESSRRSRETAERRLDAVPTAAEI